MRRNKKIIIAFVLLTVITSCAFFLNYLNKVYLPVTIKARIISALREALHRDVDIGGINFSLVNGISLYDVSVYDKTKSEENTLFYIKRVSFHFLYLPLLKEQKIIIPILRIYYPRINLLLNKEGALNLASLFPAGDKGTNKQKESITPLVYKISLVKGSLFFRDERQAPVFSKSITGLDARFSAGNLKKLSFMLRGALASPGGGPSRLSLQGSYLPSQQEINARVKLNNLSLPELQPYLKEAGLTVSSGTAENTSLDFKLKKGVISVSGFSSVKGLSCQREALALEADTAVLAQLDFAVKTKTLKFKADFKVSSARISGLPYIKEASYVTGALKWSDKGLSTEALEFRTLDSDFRLSGTLTDFSSPSLQVLLSSEQLNLKNALLLLIPQKDLDLRGSSRARIMLKGRPDELLKLAKAEFIIEDAEFKTPLLAEPFRHIKGTLSISEDSAEWQALSFAYRGIAYASSGRLSPLKNPQINFDLNSKDLKLSSDIKLDEGLISLHSLKAKYIGSDCDIKGSVNTGQPSPLLDIVFSLGLEPRDLAGILPKEQSELLAKINPKGAIRVSGSLSGKAGDFKDWVIIAQGSSESLSLYNLKFDRLSFNLAQKDKMLSILGLNASPYSGNLNLDFICNLEPGHPTYSLKFSALGALLEQMSQDIGIKDKSISGIIDTDANIVGSFKGASSIRGNGSISVRQGKLWQINLLKGLGELFLLPDYKDIVFREAHADFNIADNAVSTDNLELSSDQLKINCEGSLGFDGRLDFTAYAQVNKELIRESSDLRKFTAAILGQLGDALTIKVGGTIQKPSYRLVPLPLDVIKGIKDFFLGK